MPRLALYRRDEREKLQNSHSATPGLVYFKAPDVFAKGRVHRKPFSKGGAVSFVGEAV